MCRKNTTYNSSQRTGFVVHNADGTNCVFMPSKKGLFFSDVKGSVAHVLVNTVDEKRINTQLNSTLMPVELDKYKILMEDQVLKFTSAM